MTFEEWAETRTEFKTKPEVMGLALKEIACAAFEAGQESMKPLAEIIYVDYVCDGWYKNNQKPFWTVTNTCATVILSTEQETVQWAIKNGYRLS